MDTNNNKKEIITSPANDSDNVKNKKINNFMYLLPLKIIMFLAAIPMVLGILGVVGNMFIDSRTASNYKTITAKDKEADTYEDSNFFLNDINNLSRYLISNYQSEEKPKLSIDDNKDVFKTIEYKDVLEEDPSSSDASGNPQIKLKSINDKLKTSYTLKDIYSKNNNLKNAVEEHHLTGENYELFYRDLLKYYSTCVGDNVFNQAEYLHLTSEEYVEILDKMLTSNYYKYENIEEFENLDDYGDAKAYYSKELNKGVLVIPHESVSIIDFNSYKNGTRDNDIGDSGYKEAYVSEDNYLEFSYSFDDIYVSAADIYIPMKMINFESYDSFVDSIITTPFARNTDALASFYIENDETYRGFNSHVFYDESSLSYIVSYDLDESTYKMSTDSFEAGNTIKFDPKTGTFDAETSKRLSSDRLGEIKDAFYNVDEFTDAEVKEAYSHFSEISFAPSSENIMMFTFCKYEDLFVVMMYAGIIVFLLCLIMITAMEKREVLKIDRCFFEIKSFILIALVAGLVLIGELNVKELLHYNQNGLSIIMVLFILSGVLSYSACLVYYLGLVRLLKNRQFLDNVLIVRICRYIFKKIKQGLDILKDLFMNLSLGTKTLGITVAYGFVNFVVMFIASLIAADYSTMEPIAFATILLFIFNVCFIIYKWKEKRSYDKIGEGIDRILDGELDYQIDTSDMTGVVKDLTLKVNRIGEGLDKAVAASLKDERMKAELITNVSHDIKTPLTSIINYVDLIKREGIKDEPLKGYIDVLDMKSMRLKSLIEDLLEASKASTGNIELNPTNLNLHELISQITAEYEDKFSEKNLNLIANEEDDLTIYADGRRIYRVIDNIFQNAYKYAMPNTRVYLDTKMVDDKVNICLKNVSEQELNIEVEELLERFTRGDESRNTEGNGLGLSIASNLTKLQDGEFNIGLDGDLFKIMITMPKGR